MRILFLNPAGNLGGGERSMLDLMASLRAHSPAMELGLIAGEDGALLREARALGVSVVLLPLDGPLAALGDSGVQMRSVRGLATFGAKLARSTVGTARYAGRLRAAIRAFAPSVVHSNGIKMHILAAAARLDAPLVWHIRDFVADRPFVPRAMRAVAWRADAAVAISAAVAENARRVVGELPVSVVHDGIDTARFAPAGAVADLDALAGCSPAPPGCIRIGLVATYARWKGHDIFLEAARRVRSEQNGTDIRFYIVGGPIYGTTSSQYEQSELRTMAARVGGQAVRFVPFLDDIDEAYRALDVVVHSSSRPEPFGRTIAEAMATGKPVIAAREGGAVEIFVDGVEALGVPPREPAALARAMLSLATDAPERARLGRAARAATVTRFSRARLADQILGIYRGAGCVLSGRPDMRTGGSGLPGMVSKERHR